VPWNYCETLSCFSVQTEDDKKVLSETGGIPIGIGKNAHIRKAIIDKNARIGENVKVFC
jgi:glucose-1-phosphate adenylyltransferase